jgi:hypothetical protein
MVLARLENLTHRFAFEAGRKEMFDYYQSGSTRRIDPRFQTVFRIYLIAALVYSIYSSGTESGLAGYVIKLDMDSFGMAEVYTALPITFLILVAAAAGIGGIAEIVEKFAPSLLSFAYVSTQADPAKPDLLERANRPLQHVSWGAVMAVTAIPLATCSGALLPRQIRYDRFFLWSSHERVRGNNDTTKDTAKKTSRAPGSALLFRDAASTWPPPGESLSPKAWVSQGRKEGL